MKGFQQWLIFLCGVTVWKSFTEECYDPIIIKIVLTITTRSNIYIKGTMCQVLLAFKFFVWFSSKMTLWDVLPLG